MNSAHVIASAKPPAVFQTKGGGYGPPLRPIIDLFVALAFSVDLRDLRASKRGSAKVAYARQVSMYLAHVACSLSLTDVGILYARERAV
jgi:Bacterial dnaA protein helix-turn-helix